MTYTLVLLSAAVLISGALCSNTPTGRQHSFITEVVRVNSDASRVGFDNCKLCVEFAGQFINDLLNFVLQVGVVDTCGDLCQAFANYVGNKAVGAVCSILCDLAGVDEFMKIVDRSDLDPIFYCEDLNACPVNDHGDAKFTTFEVDPKAGPQGVFSISFEYVSKNGTGTGELGLELNTVDGIPIGQTFFHELAPAGTYTGSFNLNAEADPDCDPTQGPCEEWLPGNYTLKIVLCNGECGSKHPHSSIYDEATTYFTITKDSNTSS